MHAIFGFAPPPPAVSNDRSRTTEACQKGSAYLWNMDVNLSSLKKFIFWRSLAEEWLSKCVSDGCTLFHYISQVPRQLHWSSHFLPFFFWLFEWFLHDRFNVEGGATYRKIGDTLSSLWEMEIPNLTGYLTSRSDNSHFLLQFYVCYIC